jgi:imidazolonepropionase-like amidohydrolase
MAKDLTIRAGAACAFGLPREAALKAMTTGAAEILGVSDKIGSLTPGKVANLFISDGDPLEVTTSLHALFVNGAPIPLESRHTRLYKQYKVRLPSTDK